MPTRRSPLAAAALALGIAATVFAPRDARACGACYAQTSESTIVQDHRMALSISQERTILWDQIHYQGSPSEFAYVVPVRPGSTLEASNDAWFAALDAATRPIVMQPPTTQRAQNRERLRRGVGCGGGAAVSGCAAESAAALDADDGAEAQPVPEPPVKIVAEDVVGPYASVTVRSRDPEALEAWLGEHGYAIPPGSREVIADFVRGGFDFIALRLRPGGAIRATEPIRIVSPGADPTMPLRMMKIGAGARLGITLWVLAEGRMRAGRGFVNATIDPQTITWDATLSRSSYQDVSRAKMAENGGRTALTEYAARPGFSPTGQSAPRAGMAQNVAVFDAYASACAGVPMRAWAPRAESAEDAGTGSDDAGDAAPVADDAGTAEDAGQVEEEAGADAGAPDDGDAGGADAGGEGGARATPRPAVCDDLSAALAGLHPSDVWITRMRFDLPREVLDDTLRLEADPTQRVVDNIYTARDMRTISQLHVSSGRPLGTYGIALGTAAILARLLRRRRR